MTREVALKVDHVSKRFGGLLATNDVSFEVVEHSLTALIGPNGAGKTTLFNVISGFFRPDQGRVVFATVGELFEPKIGGGALIEFVTC